MWCGASVSYIVWKLLIFSISSIRNSLWCFLQCCSCSCGWWIQWMFVDARNADGTWYFSNRHIWSHHAVACWCQNHRSRWYTQRPCTFQRSPEMYGCCTLCMFRLCTPVVCCVCVKQWKTAVVCFQGHSYVVICGTLLHTTRCSECDKLDRRRSTNLTVPSIVHS